MIEHLSGGLLTLPDEVEVFEDPEGDLFSFGPVTGTTTPFVDILAYTGYLVDLPAEAAATLSETLACEGAGAGGVRVAGVVGDDVIVSCNQNLPFEAGEHAVILTAYNGHIPMPFPETASCSWSVQTNVDGDVTTGFPNPPPMHPLTGADRYHETLMFYSSTSGMFQNYNLATDYDEPPRSDTGQQQGNLATRARVVGGDGISPIVKDTTWWMHVVPEGEFGDNHGEHAYCFGDVNDRQNTLAVDSNWNQGGGTPLFNVMDQAIFGEG